MPWRKPTTHVSGNDCRGSPWVNRRSIYSIRGRTREPKVFPRSRPFRRARMPFVSTSDPRAVPGATGGKESSSCRPIEEEARRHVVELFRRVRISEPTKVYDAYPHELSGGMQQRVMIAMALAGEPALMIADEPTTALDVTTQAQILGLLKDLRKRIDSAILYITHDLAVIAELSDRVAVMYAAKIVEDSPVADLFREPLHPYTQGLLESIVSTESRQLEPGSPLPTIPGVVPDLLNPPSGCRFHPRCKFAFARCQTEEPLLLSPSPNRKVACHLYDKEAANVRAP